jgi:4-amino-4-deoxy-L-arabinose transferase-like glycosyltransferase
MTEPSLFRTYRMEIALLVILLLSAFLNIWNIWNQGFSNTYYAAAVKSMLANPEILFFNAFDAGGFVTVDKPPLGLWIQAASAALFGFSGWALVLPQALAGVGSVALLYFIVARPFGKHAGLIAALALAVTPIFVAVSRNGTMDGVLIFILLLAVWIALKAARENSLPCLLLAVILIGLGFNVKMIQAFIAVPAVIAVYLLSTGGIPIKKRLVHIGLALAVLTVVSLSWAVAVDSVPTDQRPYIGGSGDNTVMGLIINYNGLHRLENGMQSPGGSSGFTDIQGGSGGMPTGFSPSRTMTAGRPGNTMPDAGMTPGEGMSPPPGGIPEGSGPGTTGAPGGRTGGGMMDDAGSPGLFRLFGNGLAGQISWLLPFALIGLLAWARRPESLSLKGFDDAGYFSEQGLTLLAVCLWLFPGIAYFSFTTGFWHTYYLATIAPPLAALVGIGAVSLYDTYCEEGIRSWLLVAAIAATGGIQIIIINYHAAWSGILEPVIAAGILGISTVLTVLNLKRNTRSDRVLKIVAAIAIGLLFIAPFVWACTPLAYGSGNLRPVAGPQLIRGIGSSPGGAPGESTASISLTEYLLSHRTSETWIVAVSSSMEAANLILSTGQPVMALGGFSGSDQVLTADSLAGLIQDGKIRYFSLSSSSGNRGGPNGNDAIFSWVGSHCTEIPVSDYGGSTFRNLTRGPGMQETSARDPVFQEHQDDGAPGLQDGGSGGRNVLYDCYATGSM